MEHARIRLRLSMCAQHAETLANSRDRLAMIGAHAACPVFRDYIIIDHRRVAQAPAMVRHTAPTCSKGGHARAS